MHRALVLFCAVSIVASPCFTADTLESLFRESSHELVLEEGAVSGPAMDFLLAELEQAQFVCLAEPHNSREIPMFVSALFNRLQSDLSFRHLAIEQGPLITRRIAEFAQTSTNDEIAKAMKKRKKALHFKTVEEVGMIADVARAATVASDGVWGLDRVLDPSYVKKWLSSEDGAADPEADFLEQRASWSAENFAMYKSKGSRGSGMSPDQHREEGFKTGFLHYYESATSEEIPQPRVMVRFGHTHMGQREYRAYASLGRYLAEFAAENDLSAFHINLQAINKPGEYWSLTDYPDYEPLANVGDPSKWILVDLRPARESMRSGTLQASKKLTRMVNNFDAVLLIGGLSKGRKL